MLREEGERQKQKKETEHRQQNEFEKSCTTGPNAKEAKRDPETNHSETSVPVEQSSREAHEQERMQGMRSAWF